MVSHEKGNLSAVIDAHAHRSDRAQDRLKAAIKQLKRRKRKRKTGLITGDPSVDPHRGRSGADRPRQGRRRRRLPGREEKRSGWEQETESLPLSVSSGRCPLQASAPLPTYPSTSRSNSTGLFTARSERHARISTVQHSGES
jgi:hypothetical protein